MEMMNRARGKKATRVLMMVMLMVRKALHFWVKRESSWPSRAKHLMTRMPERLSCKRALMSAMRSRAMV